MTPDSDGWAAGRLPGRPGGRLLALPAASPDGPWLTRPAPRDVDRTIVGLVAACISLAALVNPKGPGNTAPWDLAAMFTCFAAFLWTLSHRAVVRAPYVWPMAGIMITGLLAAMLSTDPTGSSVAVIQEVFLLLWCAVVATVARTPAALGTLLRAWVASATVWALLLELAVLGGLRKLSGVGDRIQSGSGGQLQQTADLQGTSGGFRARLFFDNPNMAGNYFMIAVFIALACGYPRKLWLRVVVCVLLVGAMFLSGSNAALLSLAGGAMVTLFLRVRVRSGLVKALATVGLLVTVVGVLAVEVAVPVITAAEQSNNAALKYSIGRGQRSADARASLFTSELALYEQGNLLGIGPATTKQTLSQNASATVKSPHDDYLATLVERGPLGLLALFLLICAVWGRLTAIVRRPLPPQLAAEIPLPAALAGACAAFAMTSLTHEILHYRWFWTLLGLVAAVYILARELDDRGAAFPAANRRPGGSPVPASP